MKPITSILNFQLNSNDLIKLSEIERNKMIYNKSTILNNAINYRNLFIQISFLEANNLPDTIMVYCFKPKTLIEKEKIDNYDPADFFLLS